MSGARQYNKRPCGYRGTTSRQVGYHRPAPPDCEARLRSRVPLPRLDGNHRARAAALAAAAVAALAVLAVLLAWRASADGDAAGADATAHPATVSIETRVEPATVGNGEAGILTVSAPGAESVSADLPEGRYPLQREADRFWLVFGVPLDAQPGPRAITITVRQPGRRDPVTQRVPFQVAALERPVDELELTDALAAVLTPEASAIEERLRAQQFSHFDGTARWRDRFTLPAPGKVSTQFGQGRSYNGGPAGSFHTGTDFEGGEGDPVLAAAPGRVAWVGVMPIRGISVLIDHGGGVMSGYHHLSAATVAVDDPVQAGDTIGRLGSTGFSTGPHLHWEVSVWGINVDAMTWTLRDFRPQLGQ